MKLEYETVNLCNAIHHNVSAMKQAENTINSMVKQHKAKVWFKDENGNVWVPKGKIQINFYQGFEEVK